MTDTQEEVIDPKVAHQTKLEQLYSKNQTVPRVKEGFTGLKAFNWALYLDLKGIPISFGFDLLTQMALHRRANLPTMVGILRHHFGDSQMTADMIAKSIDANLCAWSDQKQQLIVKYTIPPEMQYDLDRFQYPLPMVVPPKKVETNTDIGYLISKGSLILKNGNHHEEDICLDHINKLNQVKFSLDRDTAHMISNKWKDLEKPKEGETRFEYQRRVRAFERYDKVSKAVIDLLLKYGNEFYLTHKYDKRGRTYCVGYHVNYAGTAWNKAVIELADKELIPDE